MSVAYPTRRRMAIKMGVKVISTIFSPKPLRRLALSYDIQLTKKELRFVTLLEESVLLSIGLSMQTAPTTIQRKIAVTLHLKTAVTLHLRTPQSGIPTLPALPATDAPEFGVSITGKWCN